MQFEPQISEVVMRIRSLREDSNITLEEMASATGRSVEEYEAQESGLHDLSFTFLYKCATTLGVDVIELLTGGPQILPAMSSPTRARGW